MTYIMPDGTPGKFQRSGGQKPEGARCAVLDGCCYPDHIGTDSYHRRKEDIALFAEMGLEMSRMSASWSRIYPKGIEEEPDQEGLASYRGVFTELRKQGIGPLVTISHYDTPSSRSTRTCMAVESGLGALDTLDRYCQDSLTRPQRIRSVIF